jgi:hypothetical protein
MKIINHTHYETKDLRRIIQRCAETTLEVAKRKHVVVTVIHARQQRGASGCAHIGGRLATIRITRDDPRAATFAHVAVHEFRHLNGWTHAQMKARYSHEDVEVRYAWANEMGIRVKQPKPKPTAVEKVDANLVYAQKMLQRAATRLKRAQTLAKKWHYKVRYYERRMAATRQA